MFIDYTENEKKSYLSQSEGYFIPGYTGHCPTLKFQYGNTYGVSTRQIIQDLSKSEVFKEPIKNLQERARRDPSFHPMKASTKTVPPASRKYILGYTGYIPGMYRSYGHSFYRLAEECEKKPFSSEGTTNSYKFNDLSSNRSDKRRSRSEGRKISSELPPIYGYTGHIPRIKRSSLSISKTYNQAVKESLKD